MRWFLLIVVFGVARAAEDFPQRVVSMSLCSDQMLLNLLPQNRIAAVSYLAQDPNYSRFVQQAQQVPVHKANIEFILSLQPDLILASRFERSQVTSMLRRLGKNVLIVDEPQSIAEISSYTMTIARALGSESRAAQQLQEMEKTWQSVAEMTQHLPKHLAVSMSANGYQQGQSSLFNELLHLAGWQTVADKLNLPFDQTISIERVIAMQPQVLLYHSAESGHSQAEQWLQHPAWRAVDSVIETHQLNMVDWICTGPWTAEVVRNLVANRTH